MDNRRRTDILARLATRAGTDPSIHDLCVVSAELIGVTGAGITLMSANHADQLPSGASDQTSARLEELQFTLGEGPCVDAHQQRRPVLEPDLAHPIRPRWPAMSAAALQTGAAAIFGYPLQIGTACFGALDLYRNRPGPLNPDQHANAVEMADVAAHTVLAMQLDTEGDQLAPALDNDHLRYLVHQTAGMVSVQLDIPVPDALHRLRSHAFSHARTIDDVAAAIIDRTLRLD